MTDETAGPTDEEMLVVAEQITKLTGESIESALDEVRSRVAAFTQRRIASADRNGKLLAAGQRVLIPATVAAVNGDILVVTLGDPMPPHQTDARNEVRRPRRGGVTCRERRSPS